MRQIRASEVTPGMTIQFDLDGWEVKGTVSRVEPVTFGLEFYSTQGEEMTLDRCAPVTVLLEPTPAQPEEPTEFGARVVVDGTRFIRRGGDTTYAWEASFGICFTWDDLLCLGQVTVVSDQGWTVPTDAPEVPERIEEWDTWEDVPEGVVVTAPGLFCHYRKARGKDEVLGWFDGVWVETRLHLGAYPGPWTRVTDA